MIEDKKLGVKIAESSDEQFWNEMKDRLNKDIEGSFRNIEISRHILKLAEEKLKDLPKKKPVGVG